MYINECHHNYPTHPMRITYTSTYHRFGILFFFRASSTLRHHLHKIQNVTRWLARKSNLRLSFLFFDCFIRDIIQHIRMIVKTKLTISNGHDGLMRDERLRRTHYLIVEQHILIILIIRHVNLKSRIIISK